VRLERIELLARDLARDLTRTSAPRTSPLHQAMADAIQTEIAAVILAPDRSTKTTCSTW
jgi:hypothetical protein